MNNIIIAPSILSADFANLERDIKAVENAPSVTENAKATQVVSAAVGNSAGR